ncbi:MAG: hypothetical protein WBZ11_09465, partial [Candidatus Sulfotelmatobacter sp.]
RRTIVELVWICGPCLAAPRVPGRSSGRALARVGREHRRRRAKSSWGVSIAVFRDDDDGYATWLTVNAGATC